MNQCLLLSGGLDSTTLAAWVRREHPQDPLVAVTFLYGQKHAVELEAARAVAAVYQMEHVVVELPPIGGSALTDPDSAAAGGARPGDGDGGGSVLRAGPEPAVPGPHGRLADARGPGALWLGVHHDDHTGYPDCRPEFVAAADQAVRLGTQYELRVRAPFVEWPKAEIIRWGLAHQVPYELTHSCYQGRRPACGVCDTCQARLAAFAQVGVRDPLLYEARPVSPGPGPGPGDRPPLGPASSGSKPARRNRPAT